MSDGESEQAMPPADKPANAAPDAVKDPNEKTEGKPGLGPQDRKTDDIDPGGG